MKEEYEITKTRKDERKKKGIEEEDSSPANKGSWTVLQLFLSFISFSFGLSCFRDLFFLSFQRRPHIARIDIADQFDVTHSRG
jgi:hypothetical protein